MWTRSFSKLYAGLKKEDIWQLWTDVNHWPTWHGDLDYCKMEGVFEVGNYFMLKPKGVKAVKIILTEVEIGQKFTDCTRFLGAKMYDTHAIEETAGGLILSNKIVVTGILTKFWVKCVAEHVANTVPNEMEALVALARKKHG